jgi:hypothetical protein
VNRPAGFRHLARGLLVIAALINYRAAMAETVPPDVKKIVTFIFPADTQGNLLLRDNNPVPYGTGFFVGIKGDDGNGAYGYLVTAKHVLRDSQGNDFNRVFLRLNRKQGDAQFVALDLVQNGKRAVYTHTDPSVDIAVVPLYPSEELFDFRIIPEELLSTKATFDEFNIAEGSDVFFVGLFTTYYGEHKNNPIVRFGRVAMFPDDPITWVDYQGQPAQHARLYLIETQSYGGNSGSPVFFSLGADRSPKQGYLLGSSLIKLAGVMRGRFNEINPTLGYIQSPTASLPVTLPNIGIAAITPSYFLHEILFSDELKKFRAEHPITPPPDTTGTLKKLE